MEQLDRFALPAVVSCAGMHQIVRFAMKVGQARGKYGVKAPATDGPEEFVRTFRAHQNALESYTLSVASLWLGSVYVHPVPASALYVGYLIGRELSFKGYVESADKRIFGIKVTFRCLLGLMLLALAGSGNSLLRHYGSIDVFKMIGERVPFLEN